MSFGRKILVIQVLQLTSLALPMFFQIWIARSIGPNAFGRFTFVSALAIYWILVCDFGFGWSATRKVALHRENAEACSMIVCATLTAKLLLLVVTGSLLWLLTCAIPELRKESNLIAVFSLSVLGAVLSPLWYFQGIERPQVTLWLDICSRLVGIPFLIAFVRTTDDLVPAALVLSLSQLCSGIGGLTLLMRQPQLKMRRPSLDGIYEMLTGGFPLFLSSSAVSLYTASSSLILGFTSTREQVGYFGLAQRLVGAACSLLTPFNQILYPQATRWIRSRVPEARAFVRSALLAQGSMGLALSLLLMCMGPAVIALVFGTSFVEAASSLRWLAALPLAIAIGNVYANLVMLPAQRDTQHLLMTSFAGALNVLLLIALADLGAIGAAIALLIAESFVALYAFRIGSRVLVELTP